jgi:hypothetical protein
MRPSYGFSRAGKQILSGQDSKLALALIIKMQFHCFTVSLFHSFTLSLSRYLAATLLVKSLGVLWRRQHDLNQYSFR